MSIKRNSLYNVAGALTPLLVTLFTTPLYLHVIGEARYGLAALMWLLLGYFGMFDFGLSAATTNALARDQDQGLEHQAQLLATSLWTQAAMGIAVGVAAYAVGYVLLTRHSFTLDGSLHAEILGALPWLAACVPVVSISGCFSGALAAREEFARSNLLAVVGTLLFQVIPLFAAWAIGPQLTVVIPAAVMGRALSVAFVGIAALRPYPARHVRFARATLSSLLGYGGWVMVTNVLGPVLTSIDQFVIGALLGPVAVARYNVGFSLASRLTVLPNAMVTSIFPRLSASGTNDAAALTARTIRPAILLMTIVSLPAILLAHPFIALWIGPAFASQAGPVAAILVLSAWLNSVGFFPFVLLRARGRPDLPAKFHALETPPFLAALWIGIHFYGLEGAAWAWAFRVAMDTALLTLAVRLPADARPRLPACLLLLVAALLVALLLRPPLIEALVLATAASAVTLVWALRVEPAFAELSNGLLSRLGVSWRPSRPLPESAEQ